MKRYFLLITPALVGLAFFSGSAEALPGDRPAVQPVYQTFAPGDVRLLEGPMKEAFDRDLAYVRSLDPDRLLYNFRRNAGIATTAAPLGGWEHPECELRGHFTGHYLTASALLYAATGDTTVLNHARRVVAGMEECQRALGPSGYISAFPEEFIDRVVQGKPVWAPWYTLHKIYAGLLDMAVYCHDRQALDVLKNAAKWIQNRIDRLSDAEMQNMLKTEFGGMGEVLANLCAVTGDPAHLALAKRFDKRSFTDPLAEGVDKLKGLHANTHIPQAIASARLYELTGNTRYRDIAAYFWKEVTSQRTFVTGGTSNYEYWRTDPGILADELSDQTHENCCSYNMLRLSRHLFCWSGDPTVADYYERTLWNAVLPTQKPEDGSGLMYYVPMHGGLFKLFGHPDSAYWCCNGSGIESFGTLANSIYFHDSSNICVALYVPSELSWKERGIVVRQETKFPDEEHVCLHVDAATPRSFTLSLRIPSWCTGKARVLVNGAEVANAGAVSGMLPISRVWKAGDKVDVQLPMALRLVPMPDDQNLAAITYGPVVLAGKLGTERMSPAMCDGTDLPEVDRMEVEGAAMQVPHLHPAAGALEAWIHPVAGAPLTFATTHAGDPYDVTLVPFFRIFHERYAVYWDMTSEPGRRSEGMDRVVDSVTIGAKHSEREHNFQAYRFQRSGATEATAWVASPLWFRYDLNVLPHESQALHIVWKSDSTDVRCEILVDGVPLGTHTFSSSEVGVVREDVFALPALLVGDRSRVAIKFNAVKGHATPEVYGVRTERTAAK